MKKTAIQSILLNLKWMLNMTHTNTSLIETLKTLIQFESISPHDAGCQNFIAEQLKKLGFRVDQWQVQETHNLIATLGSGKPCCLFAGHTDVVPPGPLDQWTSPPFEASIRYNTLYGRGACDMKGALAAFLTATETFLSKTRPQGTLMLALTSDEEGLAHHGSIEIVKRLKARYPTIDYCLIGEPSSTEHVGDGIKVGRRGSLNGLARVHGKQGHVAYLPSTENILHKTPRLIEKLKAMKYQTAPKHFPETRFHITHIHAGDGTTNVVPSTLTLQFNIRYAPNDHANELMEQINRCFQSEGLDYSIHWDHSAKPFYSPPGRLANAVADSIQAISSIETDMNTDGGTSDGRFLIDLNCEIVEFGLPNATIHQINECVKLADLAILTQTYEAILNRLLNPH